MQKQKEISSWIGFLIIVVVLDIIFGIFFIYQCFGGGSKVQTIIQTVNNSVAQTVDWKIYTNPEYGIEISIPSDWRVDTTLPSSVYLISPKTDEMLKEYPNLPIRIDLIISVEPYLYRMPGSEGGLKKAMTFNGMKAEEVTIEDEEGTFKFIYLDRDGITYQITYPIAGIEEKILESLKFITPVAKTTLQIWPDVNSFNLVDKSFEAKGVGDSASIKNIKVCTDNSTKISNKDMPTSISDIQGMYTMMKNWIGPEWWFTIKGVYQKDGSFLADDIYIFGQ